MSSQNGKYPVLNIRLDGATKAAYKALCESEGTTISADVKAFIDKRLAVGRREMRRNDKNRDLAFLK